MDFQTILMNKYYKKFLIISLLVTDLALIAWLIGPFDNKIISENKPVARATSTVASNHESLSATTSVTVKPPVVVPATFANIKPLAQSVLVYDLSADNILYAKKEEVTRPIASLSKLMTAYAATIMLPADALITISADEAQMESSAGLVADEQWKLKDLISFTLISSSNGGASALARAASELTGRNFIDEMNGLAKELGLNNTLFRNPTGLDFDEQLSGSYSTALDLAKLYNHLLTNAPAVLAGTAKSSLSFFTENNDRHVATNTNWLLAKIPNVISSKTGTTDLAGGNLAFIFQPVPGHQVAVVILGSTAQGRFADAEKLITATISHFK